MPELGITLDAAGATVAVAAPDATAITLCLFDPTTGAEAARHRLTARAGAIHHGHIPGLAAGARYGLRAEGPWDPAAGHRFNPAKLLLDPYAQQLDRAFALHAACFDTGETPDPTDSAPHMPKAILPAPIATAPPPPSRSGAEIIYELHVRGFTRLHAAIPEPLRGTFAGLAHPAAIAHLQALGVSTIELLPVAAWIDERHLPPLGLSNYWGYNPVAFLAPDPRLAPGGMAEVRAAVAALHAAGIGVLLDVVFNHTGEGDEGGPTLSLKGLGNAAYHRLLPEDRRRYANTAGCGNTLALDRPWPLRLVMDALRHWALASGIDGFRLDLATTLARRDAGPEHPFDGNAPLLAAMRQDPVLRQRRIIAEPWDIGAGGYQLGRFPPGWGEWNDRFRDDIRRFWRGDRGLVGALATRLAGSADIFAPRPASDSVNYITAHDGFTLADLVSHAARHNTANGEQNRDGAGENHSWNHGVEGPTDDLAIAARRAADARALLATLLAARGTPMLAMGDEAGRTQNGNNNAYAQDNALSWFDWRALEQDRFAFTARLIAARRAHKALHGTAPLTGHATDNAGIADVAWYRLDGTPMNAADWAEQDGRSLVATLYACGPPADRVLLALHGAEVPATLTLPPPRWGFAWTLLADSADPDRQGALSSTTMPLAPRSVLLLAEAAARPRAADAADPALLARLAAAAGIATDWQDLEGRSHAVPEDTVQALLAALSLPARSAAQARDSLARLATQAQQRRHDPTPCFLPDALAAGGRRFGITAQTYALRREGDQGIGDFTALAALAQDAARCGATWLGLSPPHALLPTERERASPYQPSDRRFLEPLLLDVTALAPLGPLPALQAALQQEAPRFAALAARSTIDYPAAWAAKRRVLAAAWRGFTPDHPAHAAFIAFRQAGGSALARYASFCAIAEQQGHTDAQRWPAGLRHGADCGVATFAAMAADATDFHAFLQWLAEQQLARAATAGAGLYRDLAVGVAPDGAEAWAERHSFLAGFSVGAPPDPLAPQGQVWGIPPPDPSAPAATFAALLAANMRHATALRIDHVMGLQRLFVVPDGAPGSAGCYLTYPLSQRLAALAAASQAARCAIIGEDLGTVPPGLRERLAEARMLTYRVLWFERDGPQFRAPAAWPRLAAACLATHDVPTLAGWWGAADLAERAELGLLDPTDLATAMAARAADKAALLTALAASGSAPLGITPDAAFTPRLAAALHAHVAHSPSAMLLVQAEDLAGETIAVNLPGTDRERPNWRRRLPVTADALLDTTEAQSILAAIAARRAPTAKPGA